MPRQGPNHIQATLGLGFRVCELLYLWLHANVTPEHTQAVALVKTHRNRKKLDHQNAGQNTVSQRPLPTPLSFFFNYPICFYGI